jgi:DNA processing protein
MNRDASSSSNLGVLTLLSMRGIGPQAVEKLRARFAKLGDVQDASPKDLDMVTSPARASLADGAAWAAAHDRASSILDEARRQGVRVLTVADGEYPALLRRIPDRPPVLYVKGTLRESPRSVACIGTREPSQFGAEVTKRIVAVLAERGWSIVSGLAIGVDTLSHEAALEHRAHTVAVLANGLDTVYPKSNEQLARRILDQGGALVSEQPFKTPPVGRNLVQRDRLQSGMSLGTIVMQTDIVGGSMHTVRFTMLQQRLLFAPVPRGRHAEEAKSRGIVALTRETGRELKRRIEADGEYGALLEAEFASTPLAVPLESREDYDKLFALLEHAKDHGPAPRRAREQMGMF